VFAYASDIEVAQHMEWAPHREAAETEAYLESCREAYAKRIWLPLAVQRRDTGRVVGSFDLRVVSAGHRVGETGYVLARSEWGTGTNVEAGRLVIEHAFEHFGLNRIQATCNVENRRSYRTLEKLGMTREGTLREYRIEKGVPRDKYMYAILASEWRRDRPKTRPKAAKPKEREAGA
jgi:ribosomal-protein-alanine N-acetyltransferase